MRTASMKLRTLFVIGQVLLAVACGSQTSLTAPSATRPTGLPAPTSTTPTGATIFGVVWGASGVTVAVVGAGPSADIDSDGGFWLADIPPGKIVLRFTGPGVDATLPLGAVAPNDVLQIRVSITGATVTLDSLQRTGSVNTGAAEGGLAGSTGAPTASR